MEYHTKQEFECIHLEIMSNSMQGEGDYTYKSTNLKSRKLSELFLNMHDFKERRNSFTSDYGNLSIFKDLFMDNSHFQNQNSNSSRRASESIPAE